MPKTGLKKYSLPSAREIAVLDTYEIEFPRQIAFALRWIYDIHGWSGRDLESLIPGVKASVWQRYAQPAYQKSRSLHVVAALSWVSQVTMSAILYGDRIAQYWPGASRSKVELFIYSGLMGADEFRYFISKILHFIEPGTVRQLRERWAALLEADTDEKAISAPHPLDITAFGRDYYLSVAHVLREFRKQNNLSLENMAMVLGVSDRRYASFENTDNPPQTMGLHLAARLKLAFHIPDTVPFLSMMKAFPGFANARAIQQQRELMLLQLFSELPANRIPYLAAIASDLTEIRRRFSRCADIV